MQIAAALIAADPLNLERCVQRVVSAGADRLHVDVMDGVFVPEVGLSCRLVESLSRITSLPIEVHLQTVNPERHLEHVLDGPAQEVLVHVETTPHLHAALNHIRAAGKAAGAAVNPGTPVDAVAELLPLCDTLLVMTSDPGTSTFSPIAPRKLAYARALLDRCGSHAVLGVDGGVTAHTLGSLPVTPGRAIAGSAIFTRLEEGANGVEELRAAVHHRPSAAG